MPAEEALAAFEASEWGRIGQNSRRVFSKVTPFSDAMRPIISTANAIEALNAKLGRAVRTRGGAPPPCDEAATTLLNPILNRSENERRMPPREWSVAKFQFAAIFGERTLHQSHGDVMLSRPPTHARRS